MTNHDENGRFAIGNDYRPPRGSKSSGSPRRPRGWTLHTVVDSWGVVLPWTGYRVTSSPCGEVYVVGYAGKRPAVLLCSSDVRAVRFVVRALRAVGARRTK